MFQFYMFKVFFIHHAGWARVEFEGECGLFLVGVYDVLGMRLKEAIFPEKKNSIDRFKANFIRELTWSAWFPSAKVKNLGGQSQNT